MKLLVPQDWTFSVWVLGVFCLHGLVLGLLGVMFTSLLDLYRASRSCHDVLDELYPEVLLSTLNSCIHTKLQNRHAQINLLYQGGQYQWRRYKIHANTEVKLMARLTEIYHQQCRWTFPVPNRTLATPTSQWTEAHLGGCPSLEQFQSSNCLLFSCFVILLASWSCCHHTQAWSAGQKLLVLVGWAQNLPILCLPHNPHPQVFHILNFLKTKFLASNGWTNNINCSESLIDESTWTDGFKGHSYTQA
jgi:hypothetical protein